MIPLLLVIGLLPSPPPPVAAQQHRRITAAEADGLIRRVEERLVKALFEREPWVALERGAPLAGPVDLGRHGSQGVAWWRDVLESAGNGLVAVPAHDLPAARRAAHESLRGWVRAADLLALSHSPERWDPVSYVVRVETALAAALAQEEPARSASVRRLLTELPAFWKAARLGLVAPVRRFSAEAVERREAHVNHMRVELSILARVVDWGPKEQEAFDTARLAAAEAAEGFFDWLAGSPSTSGGPVRSLGEENWREVVRSLSGSELTVPELKIRLLRDLAGIERELAGQRALPTFEERELEPALVDVRVRLASRAAREWMERERLAQPVEEAPPELAAVFLPSTSGPGPLARLRRGAEGPELVLELSGPGITPELAEARRALLSPPAQEALAVRHGASGALLLREACAAADTDSGRWLWNRAVAEGFELYVGDALTRLAGDGEPFVGGDAVRIELARARLVEAARLLASLEVHAEELSPDEATEAFRRRSGLGRELARSLAADSLHDPLSGIGYLGYQELRDLERDLAQRVGAEAALRRTVGLALEHPSVRPADLRRHLLPAQPRPADDAGLEETGEPEVPEEGPGPDDDPDR